MRARIYTLHDSNPLQSKILPRLPSQSPIASTYSATAFILLAGVAGLEPAVEGKPLVGVKVRCLTNLAIPQYGDTDRI